MSTVVFNPSIDGTVRRVPAPHEDWPTIRTGAGNASDDSAGTGIARIEASTITDRYSELRRAVLAFDTSSIPSGATITSATLRLYGTFRDSSLGGSTVDIVNWDPAVSVFVVDNSDYGQTGSFLRSDTQIAVGSWDNAGFNDFPLNALGLSEVDANGYTKFGVRIGFDRDGTAPTWASGSNERVDWQSAEGPNPPELSVTYATNVAPSTVGSTRGLVTPTVAYTDPSINPAAIGRTRGILTPTVGVGAVGVSPGAVARLRGVVTPEATPIPFYYPPIEIVLDRAKFGQSSSGATLKFAIRHRGDRPLELTAADTVRLTMAALDGSLKITNAACQVLDGPAGLCAYSFSVADMDTPGVYLVQFAIEWSPSRRLIAPSRGNLLIEITDAVSA